MSKNEGYQKLNVFKPPDFNFDENHGLVGFCNNKSICQIFIYIGI